MTNGVPRRVDTLAFMGGITALTAVSVDIVLPVTGVVARHFDRPENHGALIVGIYYLAYGAGQLFWGLFSDAFGRRPALIISLSGFVLASIACTVAPSFGFLVVARIVQGLMGGAPVIARAMVRDMASGKAGARLMTLLSAILTVASLLAPVVGSGMLILFDWRSLFVVIAVLGCAFLGYSAFLLEETSIDRRRGRLSVKFLTSAGWQLLANPRFLTPALVGSLTFGGYASLGAVGAITAERAFQVEPESFGALFALAAIANILGAVTAGQMLKWLTTRQVSTLAVMLLTLVSVLNVLIALNEPGLPAFWGCICLYVLALGMIFPTALAAAMEPAGQMPGFAASIVGALQMLFASIGSAVATALLNTTDGAINWTMAIFGGLAVLSLVVGRAMQRRISRQ